MRARLRRLHRHQIYKGGKWKGDTGATNDSRPIPMEPVCLQDLCGAGQRRQEKAEKVEAGALGYNLHIG